MGSFDVTIEDDADNVHSSTGGGTAGGSSFSSSGGFNNGGGNSPQVNQSQNESSHSSQTFGFASLPNGQSIKTIRIKMTDRTGETKSFPFEMNDVSVPFPN